MMHIIESEEVAKTLASLAPLTRLSRNDAHNSSLSFLLPSVNLLAKLEAAAVKNVTATHSVKLPS